MMAIQLLLGGRQAALVRGYEAALDHLAAAILGDGGRRSPSEALDGLRDARMDLAGAGVPCGPLHLLRLAAEAGPPRSIELVWHDLEAPPGRSGIALRHRFADGADPAYDVFRALAAVSDGADPASAAGDLARRAGSYGRTRSREDARGRLDRMRKLQHLVAGGPANPLAIIPSEAEIAGDHGGALAALPRLISERFDALAPVCAGGVLAAA